MKFFFHALALLGFGLAPLEAQPATPARPVDPDQAMPAQPVSPARPATPVPASPAAPPTVAASAGTTAQAALSIVADSSLKQVLQELAQGWADSQDSAPQVPLTLANGGTLRARVEAGPAMWDVVISADVDDVKALTDKTVLLAEGQHSLARNTLVVYGRKALLKDEDLEWFDLIGTEWKRVIMGNADLVVSGRVARRALEKHSLLDDDHKSLFAYAPTETVALGMLMRDQGDAVFVYKTDLIKANLPGFDIFPIKTEDAPPIFYTAAVCRLAKNPLQAHAFIDYCGSDVAKPIWAKYGFETN